MANYIRDLNFLKKNKKRNLKKKGEIILQRTKPYKVQFYESMFLSWFILGKNWELSPFFKQYN